jgi:oligogalacturonide lyase
MSKRGDIFPAETSTMMDSDTGAEYSQITAAPVHSVNLYFEYSSFTVDNRTLLFLSQRIAQRGAPYDLLGVDLEEKQMRLLSDEEHPFGSPCVAPDDPDVLYGVRGTSLWRMSIASGQDEEIARWEGGTGLAVGMLTGDGSRFVVIGTKHDGTQTLVRYDTDGSEIVTFCDGLPNCHLTVNNAGTLIMFSGDWEGLHRHPIICDIDGGNIRALAFTDFAHNMWHGQSSRLQATLLPPGHGVVQWDVDDAEAVSVCGGPYFWHSGSSLDGEWIVTDTNWPDEGLMLVHVPSGRFSPVTFPFKRGHASGNGQETHPHPSFDRTGERIIYTSNETGLSQVYVATIPDTLRTELVTGDITNRLRVRS